MEQMLVTEGLKQLKLLSARIEREIDGAGFVATAKTIETNVVPSVTKEDFCKSALASMDSINDLIKRRDNIKSAIIKSNSETYIELCGEKITVAKAIELKDSIKFKKSLLRRMKSQLAGVNSKMSSQNAIMESKIDDMVKMACGKENKNVKPEEIDAIAVPYRRNNEYSLVDPIGIENKIKELEEYIEEFEANVDSKLQISNCITVIEV